MNWTHWIKGLISAVIGGMASAVTVIVADPMTFNLDSGITKLLTVAGLNGLVAGAMYLKQSPIPASEKPKAT